MSTKAAEQLIEIVSQARNACQEQASNQRSQMHEAEDAHERAIRFYIQSNQVDKV